MATDVGSNIGEEIKRRTEQSCDAATQFVKLFYEILDKRRTALDKLYLDTASLIWSGQKMENKANILAFLEKLPSSEHRVESVDSQPVSGSITQGQTTILVTTSGIVKYQGKKELRNFYQNFMLTAQNNTWKIATDCFRILD